MSSRDNSSQLYYFFLYSIRDIFWAENHIIKALLAMKNLAGAKQLELAIDQHIEITRGHAARLSQTFEILGEKPVAIKSEAMHGLISDMERAVENTEEDSAVRDLAISAALQKIEYHEMIVYRGLSDLATTLAYTSVASLFNQTFREEQESALILAGMSEILTNKAISGNQLVT